MFDLKSSSLKFKLLTKLESISKKFLKTVDKINLKHI